MRRKRNESKDELKLEGEPPSKKSKKGDKTENSSSSSSSSSNQNEQQLASTSSGVSTENAKKISADGMVTHSEKDSTAHMDTKDDKETKVVNATDTPRRTLSSKEKEQLLTINIPRKKSGFEPLSAKQRSQLNLILSAGDGDFFEKKMIILEKCFKENKKIKDRWDEIVGLDPKITPSENLIIYTVVTKNYDMFFSLMNHTVSYHKYQNIDFLRQAVIKLFYSHTPMENIKAVLENCYRDKGLKQLFNDNFAATFLLNARTLQNNALASIDLLKKLEWLVEKAQQQIPQGFIRKIINDNIQTIFSFIHPVTNKLFEWLQCQDKAHEGLLELALVNQSPLLRYLIDNNISMQTWNIQLAAELGQMKIFQQLIDEARSKNPRYLENVSENNSLISFLESPYAISPAKKFEFLTYATKHQRIFLEKGPIQIHFLFMKFLGFVTKNLRDEMQALLTENYWNTLGEIIDTNFEILANKIKNLVNLREFSYQEFNIKWLGRVIISFMLNELETNPKSDSKTIVSFIRFLEKLGSQNEIETSHWLIVLIKGILETPINYKSLINQLVKYKYDLTIFITEALFSIKNIQDFDKAQERTNAVLELLEDNQLRGRFTQKEYNTTLMHHTFNKCSAKTIINTLIQLNFLGWSLNSCISTDPSQENNIQIFTLLFTHLINWVRYQTEANKYDEKYNEDNTLEITKFLLEQKACAHHETLIAHHGYHYHGSIFDFIAMFNQMVTTPGQEAKENVPIFQLHEQFFSSHPDYHQAMQQAHKVAIGRIQQRNQPQGVPLDRPRPLMIAEHKNPQSTHSKAVHMQTSNAASKLKEAYLNDKGKITSDQYSIIINQIIEYYKKRVLSDYEAVLIKKYPKEHFASDTAQRYYIQGIIKAIDTQIINSSFPVQFLRKPFGWENDLWKLPAFSALRWLIIELPQIKDNKEERSKITLEEVLCSVWCAVHDPNNCTADTNEMLNTLTIRFSEIMNEYPEQGGMPSCPSGAINQLISTLEGQSKFLGIMKRINTLNLFDFVRDFYEEKFTHLSHQEKLMHFKDLIICPGIELINTQAEIPSGFISKYKDDFYNAHKIYYTDEKERCIEKSDIDEYFKEDSLIPFLLNQFKDIHDFVRKEHLFMCIVQFYEDKFSKLSLEEKQLLFKDLIRPTHIESKDSTSELPIEFVKKYETEFYQIRAVAVEEKLIKDKDLKQLFHNPKIPFLLIHFKTIKDFVKQQRPSQENNNSSENLSMDCKGDTPESNTLSNGFNFFSTNPDIGLMDTTGSTSGLGLKPGKQS